MYFWANSLFFNIILELFMIKNVGTPDKIFRLIAGVVIAILGIMYQSWWGLIAIIPIATAFMNFCPLYSIIKVSTCKKD